MILPFSKISKTNSSYVGDQAYQFDDPALETLEIDTSAMATLRLFPKLSLSVFNQTFLEAEAGPYATLGIEGKLTDLVHVERGLVPPYHVSDLYLKSGLNLNVVADFTSAGVWYGGTIFRLLNENFFETEFLSWPRMSLNTECQEEDEAGFAEITVFTEPKDGHVLRVDEGSLEWFSRDADEKDFVKVVGQSEDSFEMVVDREGEGFGTDPIDVYRIGHVQGLAFLQFYLNSNVRPEKCRCRYGFTPNSQGFYTGLWNGKPWLYGELSCVSVYVDERWSTSVIEHRRSNSDRTFDPAPGYGLSVEPDYEDDGTLFFSFRFFPEDTPSYYVLYTTCDAMTFYALRFQSLALAVSGYYTIQKVDDNNIEFFEDHRFNSDCIAMVLRR